MEKIKTTVVKLLNLAVAGYIKRNGIKVIAVAGSIGKTSTTSAIRTVLSQKYKVHIPQTAYNTNKSVHLELFDLPFATSTLGWVKMVATVLKRSFGKAAYEVAVIEIGTDHPGELASFGWLKPDVGVLTAIAPEHMEYFGNLEAVAKEELVIAGFCRQLIFNANTVDRKYVADDIAERTVWYGKDSQLKAENYRIENNRTRADFRINGQTAKAVELQVLGEHSLDALLAAAAVAAGQDMALELIVDGLKAVQPVKGRMQRLDGVAGVTIIDDSYNASPDAVKAALDVLGQFDVPQRIAVLGMMNEMGDYSPKAHTEVGTYCDPSRLDQILTIGADANDYLALAAENKGCKVERFNSPYDAGEYIKAHIEPGAAILFKGSQNGVYAEEAIKPILADGADETRLVRQSRYWMDRKRAQFKNGLEG